ncbi:MAG: Abi family protein [Oscillospiraceae bacterium]|jgi:abortive infection bacteriophage resistance protein
MDYVESVKPFCTYQQQIDKLEARGLIVRDKAYAESVLRSENYYRLRGYWLTMVKKQGTPPDDVFYPGTTFENIVDVYLFDVDLREIILSATSIIETNLKAYISYYHAQKYGPIGYMNYEHFEDVNKHIWMMYELQKDKTARKDELFVQHHKKCKGGIFPVWAATELMSFGQVSKFFKNMVREDRNKMSREFYSISSREYIESWIQCAVVARNIAAHGGRFYNRFLSPKIRLPDALAGNESTFWGYAYAIYMLLPEEKKEAFISDLSRAISAHKYVLLKHISFPDNWAQIMRSNAQNASKSEQGKQEYSLV